MRRVFMYGLIAAAISAAPVAAQQPQPRPTDRPGATDQPRPGTQPGDRQGTPGTQTGDRQGSKPSTTRSGQSSSADQQFVMNAAQGNMAEVELGRLAQDKASANEVKQFGQRMVTDHSKALDELKMIASDKDMTLPTTLDAKHRAAKDKLSSLSGEQFDRAFMQQMVQGHTEMVNMLQTESKSGKDQDVKAWAAKTLPTAEEHLKMAKSISSRAVGTTGTQSGSKPASDRPTTDRPATGKPSTEKPGGSKPTPPPDR